MPNSRLKARSKTLVRARLKEGLGVEDIAVEMVRKQRVPKHRIAGKTQFILPHIRAYVQELRGLGFFL